MQLVIVFIDLYNQRPFTAQRDGLIGDKANALMSKGLESFWITECHMYEGYKNYTNEDILFEVFSRWFFKNTHYYGKQVFYIRKRANIDAIISLCRPNMQDTFFYIAHTLKLINQGIGQSWPILRNNITRYQRGRPLSYKNNRTILNPQPPSSSFKNNYPHKQQKIADEVQQAELSFKKNLLDARENHIKGREEEIRKREDEIRKRENEIRRREDTIKRRENAIERLEIEQQNEHSRFIDEQQNLCMYNMFYHCYATITHKLYSTTSNVDCRNNYSNNKRGDYYQRPPYSSSRYHRHQYNSNNQQYQPQCQQHSRNSPPPQQQYQSQSRHIQHPSYRQQQQQRPSSHTSRQSSYHQSYPQPSYHQSGQQYQQNDDIKCDNDDNKDNDKRKQEQITLECLKKASKKANQTVSEFVGGVLCALREACPIYFSKNRLHSIIKGYSETRSWNDFEKSIWLMRDDRIFAVFCDIMYTTNRNVAWEEEQQIAKDIFHVYTEYKSVHKSKFEQFAKRFNKSTSPTSNQNMSFDKIIQQQKNEQKRKQNNNNNNNFSDGDSSQCSYMASNRAHSHGPEQSKRRRNKKANNNNAKNNNKKKNKKNKK